MRKKQPTGTFESLLAGRYERLFAGMKKANITLLESIRGNSYSQDQVNMILRVIQKEGLGRREVSVLADWLDVNFLFLEELANRPPNEQEY